LIGLGYLNALPVQTEDSAESSEVESRTNCNSTIQHPCPCLLDQFGFEVAYACSPRDEEDVVKVKEAFESKEPRTHERLELNLQGDVKIPANIFGQHQTRELVLSGGELITKLTVH